MFVYGNIFGWSGGTYGGIATSNLQTVTDNGATTTNSITIGDSISPDASAVLDLKSTTLGLLIPRMTTAQRNAISTPATGLIVYDTTLNQIFFYNATSWQSSTDSLTLQQVTNAGATTTNNITAPKLIGGTAVGSVLQLQATSNNANSSSKVEILGGNNGGTSLGYIDSSGTLFFDVIKSRATQLKIQSPSTYGIEFYPNNIYAGGFTSNGLLNITNGAGNSGALLVGSSSMNNSAMGQFDSTTKGFLIPRMTTAQKNAISSPSVGLQVYDTTLLAPQFYNGISWTNGISSSTLQQVTTAGNTTTNDIVLNGIIISGNSTLNYIGIGQNIISANNTGNEVHVIGNNAGNNNSGSQINAVGNNSAENNGGNNINALGQDACVSNIGDNVNALGQYAANQNAGNNINAFGASSGLSNIGTDVNFFGESSGSNNTGSNVNAMGFGSGSSNIYNNVNLFGNGANATADNQDVYSKGTYQVRKDSNTITQDIQRNYIDTPIGKEIVTVLDERNSNETSNKTYTFSPISAIAKYRIGFNLKINSIDITQVMRVRLIFVDENAGTQTLFIVSNSTVNSLTNAEYYLFSPVDILASSGNIEITYLLTGTGSIDFNCGVTIQQIN